MMRAIEIIKKARETHENWLAYLEKHLDSQSLKEFEHVGGVNHHRKYIKEYNEVIADIEQLQDENRHQAERIEELEKVKAT